MAVEGEGDAHDLAVPAGELQRIRAPAAIRADRHDLAVMLALLAGVRYGLLITGYGNTDYLRVTSLLKLLIDLTRSALLYTGDAAGIVHALWSDIFYTKS